MKSKVKCDFCQNPDFDLNNFGAHDFRVLADTLLYHDSQLGWEGIIIHYCPMCGRRLRATEAEV